MKKANRILSALLCLVLLLGVLPVSVLADGGEEQIYWAVINKNNALQLIISPTEYTLQSGETFAQDGSSEAKGSFAYDTVFTSGQVPWIGAEENITSYAKNIASVAILDGVNPVSTARWFDFGPTGLNTTALNCVDLSGLGGNNLTNMRAMFQFCGNIEEISFPENLDTSRVTDMGVMFNYCSKLKTVKNIASWDTSKVKRFDWMFDACRSINNLDVSNWDTSSCTTMERMFDYCISLTELDVSNWNTSNVTNMFKLFQRCFRIQTLDLSNWDTSNVTNMYGMFHMWNDGEPQLTEIKGLENFDVSKVTDVQYMFAGCKHLTALDLDTSLLPADVKSDHYDDNLYSDAIRIIANGGRFLDGTSIDNGKLDTPFKAGYRFVGWYTDSTFTAQTELSEDGEPIPGCTYYAKWEEAPDSTLPISGGILFSASTTTAPELDTASRTAYVEGYPDGTVKPNGKITRAETAAILYRLMTPQSRKAYLTNDSNFHDVDFTAWYNPYVATLNAAGVITDSENGYFRPNDAITRAELAAMLAQFAKTKGGAYTFTDVTVEHWAANAIRICANLGWINGYPDGTFRPDATITRAELMAMLNRATGRTLKEGARTWSDNAYKAAWYYLDVQTATND